MDFFYKSFYTILNDNAYKDVKNVLVDLSYNYGGVTVTCQKALCYLLDNVDIRQYDVHTGTMYNSHNTLADLNLDGKIDASDTTFPNVCYDNGIPIIGERSGGGSCVVMMAATADGMPFHKMWQRCFKRFGCQNDTIPYICYNNAL